MLQNDLESLYSWATHNNMAFNGLKFECLKYGVNRELADSYDYIDSSGSSPITDAQSARDLGVHMDIDGTFTTHITKAVNKSKKLCGWINCSFINKSIELRRKLWRTYVEPVLDYGSQIYCPINLTSISRLETVQRYYTYHTENLQLYNYWERLKMMKINSVQRRQERYRIIYIFKIIQNLVPNPCIIFSITFIGSSLLITLNIFNEIIDSDFKLIYVLIHFPSITLIIRYLV